MKLTTVCSFCLVMLAAFAVTGAQLHASPPQAGVASSATSSTPTSQAFATQREHAASLETNDQDDPAYLAYKAAYKSIIEEKWHDARKRFAEVIGKYPKSRYVDDAQYWIAYSWKYSDKKKAIEVYKKFIKEYPTSNYYDDAVGDLSRLENRDAPPPGQPPREDFVVGQEKIEALARSAQEVARTTQHIYSLYTGVSPFQRKQEDPELRMKIDALNALGRSKQDEKTFELLKETALDKARPSELRETALQLLANFKDRDVTEIYQQVIRDGSDSRVQQSAIQSFVRLGKEGDEKVFSVIKQIALDAKLDRELRESAFYAMRATEMPGALDVFIDIAKKDPDERIRGTALYYIGEAGKNDPEKVLNIYKEFLMDQKQPRKVRESVIYSLSNLRQDSVIDLLIQTAKNDPDERIQENAIYYIGQLGKKKAKSIEVLTKLFDEIPKDRTKSLENVLYAVASIGTDQSVEFLGKVAKTHEDMKLRRTAVYYLGSIGGERARAVLYDILKGK